MEKIKHSLVLILVFMALLMIPLLAHADVANGVVIEAGTDEPIIGASILEQGTTNGTITDFDGNFTLNVAPGATLVVSYVGYKSQTLPAGTNLRIQLAEDSEEEA